MERSTPHAAAATITSTARSSTTIGLAGCEDPPGSACMGESGRVFRFDVLKEYALELSRLQVRQIEIETVRAIGVEHRQVRVEADKRARRAAHRGVRLLQLDAAAVDRETRVPPRVGLRNLHEEQQ